MPDNYNRIRKQKLAALVRAVDKHGLGSKQHLKSLAAYEKARQNYGG